MATKSEDRQGNVCSFCEHPDDIKRSFQNAVMAGHDQCLKELLLKSGADAKSGADVKSEDDVKSGAVVKDLLPDKPNSDDLGQWLTEASRWGHEKCLKLLIEAGADVNVQDEDGRTALMMASHYGCSACVNLLIESGAVVNDKSLEETNSDDLGQWLIEASGWGHERYVALLIEAGADVNVANDHGRTALYEGIIRGTV